MNETTPGNDSKTFVLRLWTETADGRSSWRFSLEDPRTRGRRRFESLREVGSFLSSLCPSPRPPRPRKRPVRSRVAAFLFALLLPCGAALGQSPRLALGHAVGIPGSAVAIPVVLSSGEEPVGALSLRVRVEPPAAAESVTFRRAAAWATRKAAFEARPLSDGAFSWIFSLAEPASAAAETVVGEVVVRLARSLLPGTEVSVVLDPSVSGFGDRDGTRFRSAGSGGLLLADGTVDVVARLVPDVKR